MEQGKSAKNLLLSHLRCAFKTTLANSVFAQVHEQGMRRNKENLRKNLLPAHPPSCAYKTTLANIVYEQG
jgi:hypothetical protein